MCKFPFLLAEAVACSFGDTLSGTENENCSAFSDVVVQSQINSGNASSPMHDNCFEPFQIRKKKLANQWRWFINPLMWCSQICKLDIGWFWDQKIKAPDVAYLKDAPGVATSTAVNTEEFRRNDILSSLE
ncbi:hypothetical protein K1719_013220 [Acacia pycnantha]|nr:hypothetical protein K1719_013220 [Acacia pycnantha]